MKRCPQCNFSQPDDTYDFCPKCGSKLEIVIKQGDSPRQETEQLSPKKNISASAIIGGIIVAIAVVILSVAIVASTSISERAVNEEFTKFCETKISEYEPYEAVLTNFSVNDKREYIQRTVSVVIDFNRDITEAEYDAVYDAIFGGIFAVGSKRIQVTQLDVRDTSGNDYRTGYWDRERKREQEKAPTQSKSSSSGSSMVSNPGVSTEDAQWGVYLMAQQQVPNYIASPSTMKFCVFSKCEIKDVGWDIWKGSGYFDSENMYGAEVRSTWNITCTIKDGKIHMAKLKINDDVVYNDGTQ